MVPINNSDTAWLVVADYNQDNAIGYPDELREDILNPNPDANCLVHELPNMIECILPYDNGKAGDRGGSELGSHLYAGGNVGSHSTVGGYLGGIGYLVGGTAHYVYNDPN